MDILTNVANKIFSLRKKIGRYVQPGDIEEVNRLQLHISQLQQKYGVTKGRGWDDDDQH